MAKLKNLNHGCTHGKESNDIYAIFKSATDRFSSLHWHYVPVIFLIFDRLATGETGVTLD